MANLSLKNLELCEELTHIDNLAKRLEMDKDHVLETADMELQETKVSYEKVRRKTLEAVYEYQSLNWGNEKPQISFLNRKKFKGNRKSSKTWRMLSPK